MIRVPNKTVFFDLENGNVTPLQFSICFLFCHINLKISIRVRFENFCFRAKARLTTYAF